MFCLSCLFLIRKLFKDNYWGENMKVSVVIPTKNEEKTIGKIIERVKPCGDEILIVDGHSKDRTREIANELGVRVVLDNKKSKGDAIRVGLKEAKNEIVVFIDADGSHNPDDIPKLVKPIKDGKADIVVASRQWGGSDEVKGDFSSCMRMIGSAFVTMIINYRFNVRLTDCENGYRAVLRDKVLRLNLNANDFDIEEEMTMKALKKRYRIMEVASHEYDREYGKSNLSLFKMGYKFIFRLIRELF